MPKIIWMMSVSLDGYMEGPEHDLDWQIVDDELHQHFNDELRTMAAFCEGRVTYELMARFWPTADGDPASTPPMVEFAGIWREKPKYVFSRSIDHADWNTTVVSDVVPETVRAIQADVGGDIMIGGAELAAAFRRYRLVDEYRMYVHPVVLGAGTAMFAPIDGGEDREELRLVENRAFGSGVVLLRYDRLGR
jgi:dihydrofolate reductase